MDALDLAPSLDCRRLPVAQQNRQSARSAANLWWRAGEARRHCRSELAILAQLTRAINALVRSKAAEDLLALALCCNIGPVRRLAANAAGECPSMQATSRPERLGLPLLPRDQRSMQMIEE